MNVVYVTKSEGIEKQIVEAFKNRKDSVVKVGTSELVMPIILNFSLSNFRILKRVLGSGLYRWITDLRTVKTPTEAAIDRFSFKIKRIVKNCKNTGSDIVVVFEENENIDLLRDELKLWIRTK